MMADEVVVQPAAFDPKAMETLVQGAVKSSLDALVKEGQANQARMNAEKGEQDAAAAAAADAAKRGQDPFSSVLEPHLAPALKAARDAEQRANMAADAATFYTDPANASVAKYRAKIEDVVQAQAKRGNIITRVDAWNWLRGGELYQPLQEEYIASHTAKLEEARKASAAAGSAPATLQLKKPLMEMETAELGEAIKGMSF